MRDLQLVLVCFLTAVGLIWTTNFLIHRVGQLPTLLFLAICVTATFAPSRGRRR